jgi:hypothetical protein
MRPFILLLFYFHFIGLGAFAQEHSPCDQHDHSKDVMSKDDSLRLFALESDAAILRVMLGFMEKLDPVVLPEALKSYTTKYKVLRERAISLPVLAALVTTEDYDRVVALANRLRYIALGVYFIEESRTAHPWGPYGALHNCKHP